jgi:hypothetical protein
VAIIITPSSAMAVQDGKLVSILHKQRGKHIGHKSYEMVKNTEA